MLPTIVEERIFRERANSLLLKISALLYCPMTDHVICNVVCINRQCDTSGLWANDKYCPCPVMPNSNKLVNDELVTIYKQLQERKITIMTKKEMLKSKLAKKSNVNDTKTVKKVMTKKNVPTDTNSNGISNDDMKIIITAIKDYFDNMGLWQILGDHHEQMNEIEKILEKYSIALASINSELAKIGPDISLISRHGVTTSKHAGIAAAAKQAKETETKENKKVKTVKTVKKNDEEEDNKSTGKLSIKDAISMILIDDDETNCLLHSVEDMRELIMSWQAESLDCETGDSRIKPASDTSIIGYATVKKYGVNCQKFVDSDGDVYLYNEEFCNLQDFLG